MIDEEGNEIDDDLWADMMEVYAQGFVSGGGGGCSDDVEGNLAASENEKTDSEKSVISFGKSASPYESDFPEDIPF